MASFTCVSFSVIVRLIAATLLLFSDSWKCDEDVLAKVRSRRQTVMRDPHLNIHEVALCHLLELRRGLDGADPPRKCLDFVLKHHGPRVQPSDSRSAANNYAALQGKDDSPLVLLHMRPPFIFVDDTAIPVHIIKSRFQITSTLRKLPRSLATLENGSDCPDAGDRRRGWRRGGESFDI